LKSPTHQENLPYNDPNFNAKRQRTGLEAGNDGIKENDNYYFQSKKQNKGYITNQIALRSRIKQKLKQT
jgi:hypothetical protein